MGAKIKEIQGQDSPIGYILPVNRFSRQWHLKIRTVAVHNRRACRAYGGWKHEFYFVGEPDNQGLAVAAQVKSSGVLPHLLGEKSLRNCARKPGQGVPVLVAIAGTGLWRDSI